MSTTPTLVPTSVTNDLNWLKTHAILLIIIIALAFGVTYGIEYIIASHDAKTASNWEQILQTQTAQTKVLSDKLTSDEQNWSQQNTQQENIISQLATAMSKRDQATVVQVKQDATLSATDAAQTITVQTKSQPGEVLAVGDNVQLSLSASRTVASGLDLLPTVQEDLSDTKKQLTSETIIATNLQSNVTDQKTLIDAMNVTSADADKTCKAQITSLKADARKSKLKWFAIGYVLGLVSGRFIQ